MATERCPRCNGGGTLYGTKCPCCGQRTYADDPCPNCDGTGEIEVEDE